MRRVSKGYFSGFKGWEGGFKVGRKLRGNSLAVCLRLRSPPGGFRPPPPRTASAPTPRKRRTPPLTPPPAAKPLRVP